MVSVPEVLAVFGFINRKLKLNPPHQSMPTIGRRPHRAMPSDGNRASIEQYADGEKPPQPNTFDKR